jgi:hypothetical protein
MKLLPRHKFFLAIAVGIFCVHLLVAAFAKPSFGLTLFGDGVSCALLFVAILAVAENSRAPSGILPLFWKLTSAGLFMMLFSQIYWFYYDSLRRFSSPSPIPGDSLFLLAHVFFLSALALRPHSASAGRDLRIRGLDFVLLTLWWFTLYGYFSFPWQSIVRDFSKYNPSFYFLAFIQHLVLITALGFLCWRNPGRWRSFYGHFIFAFVLIAAGNLLLSVAIDRGVYYAGSFFDTPFFLALVWFTLAACFGPSLEPREDPDSNRELTQRVWTARVATLAILSLPLMALFGYYERNVPPAIALFRLRLVFGAVFVLGMLAFRKLNLLAHELEQLVRLTSGSIENLKSVQAQVTHSEKLAALGRLAAGAAHEISNPLTAILGYSELLSDIPSLSPQDRENAEGIRRQVHQAQAAVNSLRSTLRSDASASTSLDKNPAS